MNINLLMKNNEIKISQNDLQNNGYSIQKVMKSPQFYIIIIVIILISFFAYLIFFQRKAVSSFMLIVVDWIHEHAFLGMLVYFCIDAIFTFVCLPKIFLSLLSGALFTYCFGLWVGLIIGATVTSLAQIIAGIMSFIATKYILYDCCRYYSKEICSKIIKY